MVFRLILLTPLLLVWTNSYSQTFVWKDANKIRGSVTFEDVNVNFLIIKFDSSFIGYDYASQIYKRNVEKYQSELEEILESSGINYTLISRSQLQDSAFMDTKKYPVEIDHDTFMAVGNEGQSGSFLMILIKDRRTKIKVSVRLSHWSSKYTKPYKKFIRRIKKGKSMRMKMY